MEEVITKSQKKDYLFLVISYVIRYFADALFFSFYQVYILSKGLSEDKLGVITGIMPIVVILANPFWNMTIKNINSNKKIMQIMTIIEGIFIIIFGSVSTFEIFMLIAIGIAILDQPFYSILDGYTTIFGKENKTEFAKIRKYGSLAYIVGASLGGIFIAKLGYQITFIISGMLYFIPLVTFGLIKPFKINESNNKKDKSYESIKKLFKNKEFIFYSVIYVVMFGTAYIASNFFNPYMVKIKGISEVYLGYIKAYEVIFEVITILILTKFGKNLKESNLYIFISIFYLSKILPIAFNLPTSLIIIIAGFHGIGFGSLIYVHYNHVLKLVGEELTTAAILFITILNAIYTCLGNVLIGYSIRYNGYNDSFKILFILSITIVIIMIIRKIKNKNSIKEEYKNETF